MLAQVVVQTSSPKLLAPVGAGGAPQDMVKQGIHLIFPHLVVTRSIACVLIKKAIPALQVRKRYSFCVFLMKQTQLCVQLHCPRAAPSNEWPAALDTSPYVNEGGMRLAYTLKATRCKAPCHKKHSMATGTAVNATEAECNLCSGKCITFDMTQVYDVRFVLRGDSEPTRIIQVCVPL